MGGSGGPRCVVLGTLAEDKSLRLCCYTPVVLHLVAWVRPASDGSNT